MITAAMLGGWVTAGIALLVVVAARRALDARMEAVARACHELRGPLTAVRLGLGLGALPSRRGGGSSGLSPARLRAIDTELGRASLALDDLASFSVSVWVSASVRAGAPRLRALERVDLGVLVEDAVQVWQAAGRGLRVQWEGPQAAVWGDRLRLAQAVGNLIANAVEHGGTDVCVRGGVAGGRVRVEVADDGPGLPAPVRELARRARHGRGARGRGLAIAMAVAAAHGGRVAAAPCARGARLVLELPAAGVGGVGEVGGAGGGGAGGGGSGLGR